MVVTASPKQLNTKKLFLVQVKVFRKIIDMSTLRTVKVILDHHRDIVSVMTGSVEGGVVGDDEGNIDGGHDDDHVPHAFQISVMRKYELWLLCSGCFVFWKWLM